MVTKKLQHNHNNTDGFWLKGLIVLFLCLAAGLVGAKLQAMQTRPIIQEKAIQNPVDNSTLSDLSAEIGHLKGRILALEAVRNSMARSSGLDGQMAEIATLPGLAAEESQQQIINDDVSLDGVALQLSGLQESVSREEDLSYFMGLSLADQTGFHASLPTISPVKYPALSSSFGWRKNPVSGKNTMHEGLDFAAPWGAPVKAASGGIVTHAGRLGSYGNMVEIDHGNGLVTRYAHVSKMLVKTGDLVNQGQQIAKVGSTGRSTGAHLHFEVRVADYPLDPRLFIGQNMSNNKILVNNDIPISANKS